MMIPVSCHTHRYRSYQQALDDFGIAELLAKLSNASNTNNSAGQHIEQQELESVAAILITQLTESINSHSIAKYLHAIRNGNRDIIPGLINLKFSPQSIDLPTNFPKVENSPRFLYGDKLRWRKGSSSDWGQAIGRFYSFAPHRCSWMWCYLIWLSEYCPSAAWTVADIAWEEDLEPLK